MTDEEPLSCTGGTPSSVEDGCMGDSDGDTATAPVDDCERLMDAFEPDPVNAGGRLSAVVVTD